MTRPDQWSRDPHLPATSADPCGHRNPKNGHHCTRATGHEGRHAWTWQHMPTLHGSIAGRVRDVWE